MPKPKVLFMFGRGGGGHKASARAVRDALLSRNENLDVELVDVGYLMESFVFGRKMRTSGFDGDELYNLLMKHGWYRTARLLPILLQITAAFTKGRIDSGLRRYFAEQAPAAVVSFVPFVNKRFRKQLHAVLPNVHFMTVVTDFTSCDAHPWLDKFSTVTGQRHHIAAGNASLVKQAAGFGFPEKNILATSGMCVHPSFLADYEPARPQRASSAPAKLTAGDAGHRTRVVLFFGGFAPPRTLSVVKSLAAVAPDAEIVVLCGGNDALRRRLQKRGGCVCKGFIPAQEVAATLRSASFIIGKPGPGAVSEAVACGVPIVAESRRVMTQEQPVLDWVQQAGVGVVVNDLTKLPADIATRASACEKTVKEMPPNRACFEVADKLQEWVQAGVKGVE